MKTQWIHLLLLLGLTGVGHGEIRTFTDDGGRQVEAELAGVRGAHVVLQTRGARGLWPIQRLAKADQAYVKEWQSRTAGVKQIMVQAFERDGMGEKGARESTADALGQGGPPGLPPIPAPKVEKTARWKHYELQLENPSQVDARHLRVAYVCYVIQPDGNIGIFPGSEMVTELLARQSTRVLTEGVNAERTKTTRLKLMVSDRSASVQEATDRDRDQFGGVWVRVYGPDNAQIGELKRLSPALTKLNPPWQEEEVNEAEALPMLPSFDALLELAKKLLPPTDEKSAKPPFPALPD